MDMINITLEGKEYQLDIEQAEKLGLLKEKDNKVKSWDEFNKKHERSGGYCWSDLYNDFIETDTPVLTKEQLTPHEAKALAAFSKLLKLRRDWIGEWEPDDEAYAIVYWKSIMVEWIDCKAEYRSLSFSTVQMAREFAETFRDLIEDAKILI